MERRLAAIMATDVVGYSRLIRSDEEGTLAALKALRADLIDPKIAEHHGRVVKLMGDGMLAEFASAVDAVRAAVEAQRAVAERNADLPEDKRIAFRVGINLGDVVVDGDDIHGDGVNVAARLEGLAEAGGICISGGVYDQVRDRIDFPFEDLGEHQVKNIDRPVRVWRWVTDGVAAAGTASADKPLPLPDKPSIAVLPFDNMSGDPEQEYFADGLTEDIITALSKVSAMRVIARNSTFAYKGVSSDLRRVAETLGVRYVVEGSVRRGGERLRITAQLIDAADGSHLWAERFDRVVDDLFDIQDEITKEIVTALRVQLTDGEEALVWSHGTDDVEAWQCCVRATELFLEFHSSDHLEARALAERAVERDPTYAHAWAVLGFTYWWDGRLSFTSEPGAKYAKAKELADRAAALDDTVPWVIGLQSVVACSLGQYDEAIDLAERGTEHHPGNAEVRAFLGFALSVADRAEDALDHIRSAIALNPISPSWYLTVLARSLTILEDFDDALAAADRLLSSVPQNLQGLLLRTVALDRLGRKDDAREAMKELRKIAPPLRARHLANHFQFKSGSTLSIFTAALRRAGLSE